LLDLIQDKLPKNEMLLNFDILKWANDECIHPISLYEEKKEYKFYMDDQQSKIIKRYLDTYSGISEEYQIRKLLEPFHGMHRKNLLFKINSF